MQKIIHYCWFGDKPLSKMAKKCIKSWEKYLPDYKIIKWSEENVDLNECAFIKGAYENKKWAFVADYVRTKALKEYGGIYFDTDIELLRDITDLINEQTDSFLGIEDSGYVAVGVWFEKNKNAILPTKLLKEYQSIKEFEVGAMCDITIPKMISKIVNKYGFKNNSKEVQYLQNNIVIFPRDYFYPYSYDWSEKVLTSNTYAIHYYDASWLPLKDKLELYLVRKLGKKNGYRTINLIRFAKAILRKGIKLVLFPFVLYRKYRIKKQNTITKEYLSNIESAKNKIEKYKNKEYITFYNPSWKGVTSSTTELFNNIVPLEEIHRRKDAKSIAKLIATSNIKQVIFSSFAKGWKELAVCIKKYNKDIKLKTFWHGSHSQVLEIYGWNRNKEIIQLHRKRNN